MSQETHIEVERSPGQVWVTDLLMLLAETIYRGYGETEAVMDVGFIMVTGV